MSDVRYFRILIVEDELDWVFYLKKMYQEILTDLPLEIIEETTVDDAKDRLREAAREGKPFDLLSLDILVDTKSGEEVMAEAASLGVCKGLVVITGLHFDESISLVYRTEREVRRVRSALGDVMDDLFSGRNIYWQKIESQSPADFVRDKLSSSLKVSDEEAYKAGLAALRDRMQEKAQFVNRFYQEGKQWIVRFEGQTIRMADEGGERCLKHLIEYAGTPVPAEELEPIVRKRPRRAGPVPSGGGWADIGDEDPRPSAKGPSKSVHSRDTDIHAYLEWTGELEEEAAEMEEALNELRASGGASPEQLMEAEEAINEKRKKAAEARTLGTGGYHPTKPKSGKKDIKDLVYNHLLREGKSDTKGKKRTDGVKWRIKKYYGHEAFFEHLDKYLIYHKGKHLFEYRPPAGTIWVLGKGTK